MPIILMTQNTNSDSSETIQHEFRRTVTTVGEGRATYVASVTPVNGFEVWVVLAKLVFKEKNEKLSFKLNIKGPKIMKDEVVFGHLIWEDKKK